MKRKNLIALTKDIKINKIYSRFKNIVFNNVKKESFALAVSGGSDSLCLATLSKIYSLEFKNKLFALIVDHKIRKESTFEAKNVKRILAKKGIPSTILTWKGKLLKKNIQRKARDIRYSLMANYCFKKKIKYLIVAHHMDDQIENFFIRLFRGSGLKGLSSMSEISNYNKNLQIIRPFLVFKKSELEYVTLNFFDDYIKDPSNDDDKYLRIRIRKYRESMEKEGLDVKKIIKTVDNLYSANRAINFYKNKALNKYVTFLSKNNCVVSEKIFAEEAGEIIFKSFSDILSLISGTYYPPRSKKIINLIKRLKNNKFKKSTLGGCIIEKNNSFVSVSKEQKVKKIAFHATK